jgi:hypothetical protein
MTKKLVFFFSLLFVANSVFAQIFGNEWINYNQQYYTLKIWEDGLYKITKAQLNEAGIPIESIDPRNIQLFGKNQQIPIYIEGEQDGVFNDDDYIEFFATKNTGFYDRALYTQPEFLPDEEFSLFTDTLNYYITWNNSVNNLRVNPLGAGNFTGYTPLNHLWVRSKIRYNNSYLLGDRSNLQITLPAYVEGEGWFSTNIGRGQNRDVALPTPNALSGPQYPELLIKAVTTANSNPPGDPNHHLRISYGPNHVMAVDTTYRGFRICRFSFNAPNSILGNTTNVRFSVIDDLNLPADNQNISHVELFYPHSTSLQDLEKFEFLVRFNPTRPGTMLQVSEFSAENAIAYVIYENQVSRIIPQNLGEGSWRFIVPNHPSGSTQKVILTSISSGEPIGALTPVNGTATFRNYVNEAQDSVYLIITHPLLINEANNYATYRSSHPTRPFNTMVTSIEDLYHQFGAGIMQHPRSIRRFANYLINTYPTVPSHLFLIGKSVNPQFTRFNETNFSRNLVPTYGTPPSDIQLTAGLAGNLLEPAIPTGRIAARFPVQVNNYRTKVQAMESVQPNVWTKRIINFGGGGNTFEQNQFRNFLRNYENIFAGENYGAITSTFLKTSSAPIQITTNDSVRSLIEGGVMMMNFFGHSSAGGFDSNIDNPENYNNQGRYPFVMSNGCYSGDIHLPSFNSISEQFVMSATRGSIGFLATVDLGLGSTLNLFTNRYYQYLARDYYGKTMGEVYKITAANLQGPNPSREMQNTILTYTFHGDPAIILYAWDKPDLAISSSSISFEPQTVTQEVDSIDVKVIIKNLGKTTNEEFAVTLVRHFPNDLGDSSYVKVREGIFFSDTVVFTIPAYTGVAVGSNLFDVYVDVPNYQIDELENDNNNVVLGRELFIAAAEAVPIFPPPYAIIPESNVVLQASTGNPSAEMGNYIFQIDTLRDFSSSFMQQQTVSAAGGVFNWSLPFSAEPEKVYYWRVGPNDAIENEDKWRESSFRHTPSKSGWGQSHRQQKINNRKTFVEHDVETNEYSYLDGLNTFFVKTFNNASGQAEFNQCAWGINTSEIFSNGCGTGASIYIAVIDPNTLTPWGTYTVSGQNPQNQFGNFNNGAGCASFSEPTFMFSVGSESGMRGLDSLINHVLPEGFHMIGYTFPRNNLAVTADVYPQIFETFEAHGLSGISPDMGNVPLAFYLRKGFPDESQTEIGTTTPAKQLIELNVTVPTPVGSGTVQSLRAGPFNQVVELNANLNENGEGNEATVSINTIPPLGQPVVTANGFDINQDLSTFSQLNNTPVRLGLNLNSPPNTQPAQLKKWEIITASLNTELAVNASEGFYFPRDSVQEGENIYFSMPFTNVSTVASDSVIIRYRIESVNGTLRFNQDKKIKPLAANETYFDTLTVNTQGYAGINVIRFEVNPILNSGQRSQPEYFFNNNLAQATFRVGEDAFNPLLDVTFDGTRIMNGELVSAQPFITISMEDENPFLMLDSPSDTTYFQVFLKKPSGNQERIYFLKGNGIENMRFIPATGSTNKVTIEFNPSLREDGDYKLTVQARDKSGNQAGKKDYEINFKVINKSSITQMLNYPNPFSTRTQFVFTLTGSQLPDHIKIQIMTVTGRVVKEIFMDELGPIRIGQNRTAYWWDGTDNFGDKLANGVYLYRVITKMNGETIDRMETGADKFFKEEFGKMYIMR